MFKSTMYVVVFSDELSTFVMFFKYNVPLFI